MKTKTIKLYCDLPPGWHDWEQYTPCAYSGAHLCKLPEGFKRVEIVIELPMHGGSALADHTTKAMVPE